MVAEEHSRGRNAFLISNLDNGLSTHDGTTCAAKRTVSLNMDALLLAEVNDLLLGKLRVVFDLVNSGHDSCMRQKLFQVLLAVLEENVSWVDGSKVESAYVANTDSSRLASSG